MAKSSPKGLTALWKGEIAHYEQFLLFQQCFRNTCYADTYNPGLAFGYFRLFIVTTSTVAHLSDAPRRRLVVTGESARIQNKTTENSAWLFNVLGV